MNPEGWLPLAVRKWLYGVTLAGLAVAAGYGLVDGDRAGLWIALAAAALVPAPAVALTHAAPAPPVDEPPPRHAASDDEPS